MNITDLNCGERGIVTQLDCRETVKERLRALRIAPGESVRLLKVSFFKKTYLLQAGSTQIALRREIAQCVSIKRI